jgi:sarcosine oxidase
VRVAIVGAGINGVAAAYALASAGDEVTLYEQFRLGHTRGSSHGASRIFRLAYPDPEWVRLAQEALPGWRALEADSGATLLELNGLVELAPAGVEGSRAALEACGARCEEVTGVPGLTLPGPALLQLDAGIILADVAHRAFLEGALRRGARLVEEAHIEHLDALDADAVVVTAGPWIRRLVPDLPVETTRETVCYFRLSAAPPSVVDYDTRHGVCWVFSRFDGVEPEPERVETCFYTSTRDERFLLERRGRVVVGSACSGHGFKFAPVVGERLAALARS